ncbi:hypothetical protein ACA910_002969 [Epithemia clementina (nom. ined.)]
MGKGSNVQKKQQAQLRNAKDRGKTEEERKAAAAKATVDKAAFKCELCLQTFMISSKPPLLWQHVQAKHPAGTSPTACFPELLKDFDPNDPLGEKKAAELKAAAAQAAAVPVKKKVVKKNDDLDSLLDAGLTKGKKK